MTAMDGEPLSTPGPPANLPAVTPAKPRGGWLGTLLYGRNVDRTAKARTRVRLAMLGFAAVYLAIGVRLVMFAVVPESHFVRRGASRDAIATARPDILDRNGAILATDVRAPSLFAEPRKIIDVDEATELLTAVLPDLDPTEVRDRIGSRKGFVWLRREITPKQRQEIYKLGLPGRGLPRREQARLSEQRRSVPPDRSRQHRQPGHRRHREMARRSWLAGAASRRPCHRPAAEAGRARRRSARAACAPRRADLRRREIQGEGRRRPRRRCRDRRDRLDGVAAGLRSQQPEAGQRSAPHQPPDHRRVRARLDLQGADAWRWRSIPASTRSIR